MNTKLAASVIAGVLGGLLSHFSWTPLISHPQSPESAPKEVRSQSFVLVDDKGNVQGVLSFDEPKGTVTHLPSSFWIAGGTRFGR